MWHQMILYTIILKRVQMIDLLTRSSAKPDLPRSHAESCQRLLSCCSRVLRAPDAKLQRPQITEATDPGAAGQILQPANMHRFWCRHWERLLLPEELFLLQGQPMEKHSAALANTSLSVQRQLSGDAWNYFSFATGFVSALACLPVDWFQGAESRAA